jgi:prepilin-type N-terminal cleavage/methylation domain-containing protein
MNLHAERLKRAFTLVELLVVIAIILMLVALLMPSLARVRETSKNIKCMSNMRQISMATFTYAADNDGFAPWDPTMVITKYEMFVSRSHDTKDPTYKTYYPKNKWFGEYLSGEGNMNGKMNPVAYCPKGGIFGEIGPNVPNSFQFNFSYGLNPDLGEDWWLTNGNPDRCSVPLSQIKNPAQVCLWIESNKIKAYVRGEAVTGRHFSRSKTPALTPGPTSGPYSVYQYEGRVNVVYIDQHIASFKLPEEIPWWSCSFWDHSRKTRCRAGDCGYCDRDLK